MPDEESKLIPVRVVVRSRPISKKEVDEGCISCLTFTPNHPQLSITNKPFTFDFVFPPDSTQNEVYDKSVASLVDDLFKGYNATVLAYGQTGSGKTHTMGTLGAQVSSNQNEFGVIPRVVDDIFTKIEEHSDLEYLIKVSFLEIYKEEFVDLLATKKTIINIRDDEKGGTKVVGLTEMPVTSIEETMNHLELGSMSRSTASTQMNTQSSRSHAIFTIHLEMRKNNDTNDVINAKFHLVDLAGSERVKKTGAEGVRFQEGVKINQALLALGNVISALGDDSYHVPYRDSKLTRMLQDSLGGNSHTIMIACVSPADSNMEETINTLRYADRARKIKNKPIVNRDPYLAEVQMLREQVQSLRLKLDQGNSQTGTQGIYSSKTFEALLIENAKLKKDNKTLAFQLQDAINKTTDHCEEALSSNVKSEDLESNLSQIIDQTEDTLENFNKDSEDYSNIKDHLHDMRHIQSRLKSLHSRRSLKNQEFSIFTPKGKKARPSLIMEPERDRSFEKETEATQLPDDPDTSKHDALNRQLDELDKDLALKENLVQSLSTQDTGLSVTEFVVTIQKLESEIATLSKEKEELNTTLKSTPSLVTVSKISEQRRKRLLELEGQINNLKTEVTKKTKLLRQKEECERKVKNYERDILQLKQTRVKLIRDMKEEAEKNRLWKAEKTREVNKLKAEDKKMKYQLAKQGQSYAKEKVVLQRKLEDAKAVIKRLKLVTDRKKEVAKQKENLTLGSKIRNSIMNELEIETTKIHAKTHLENLLVDRKAISEQIKVFKNKWDKLKADSKDNDTDPEYEEENKFLESQIANRNADLKAGNAQISELQKQIYGLDQDEKGKNRWDSISSLMEAKLSLQFLFDKTVEIKRHNIEMKKNAKEDFNLKMEYLRDNKALGECVEALRVEHEVGMKNLRNRQKEQTLLLMSTMKPSEHLGDLTNIDAELVKRLKFQEEEIKSYKNMFDMLKKKNADCHALQNENETLKSELKVLKDAKATTRLLPSIKPLKDDDNFTIQPKPKKSLQKRILFSDVSSSENDDNDNDDDVDKDPDWRKTPHVKHSVAPSSFEEPKRQKATTVRCYCKGSCSHCSCRKAGVACSEKCKCSHLICQNLSSESTTSLDSVATCSKTLTNSNVDELQESLDTSQTSPKATTSAFTKPQRLFFEKP